MTAKPIPNQYAVVLTRIRRGDERRDERSRPESVICRCEFAEQDTARRTAALWSQEAPVTAGYERVKIVRI